jgi:hypothetical protein
MIDWLDQKYLRPADPYHDTPFDTATALSHDRSVVETRAGSGKTWLPASPFGSPVQTILTR